MNTVLRYQDFFLNSISDQYEIFIHIPIRGTKTEDAVIKLKTHFCPIPKAKTKMNSSLGEALYSSFKSWRLNKTFYRDEMTTLVEELET